MVKYKNIMVDIETLSTSTNAAILSIGAVKFNMKSREIGDKFYKIIDLQSCLDLGMEISPDTFYWWLKQSEEARNQVSRSDRYHLVDVLHEFVEWIGDDTDCQIWGNSPSFDLAILKNAFSKLKIQTPWGYSKERDVRTLVALAPVIKTEYYKTHGMTHNALDDCLSQITYCCDIFQTLTT